MRYTAEVTIRIAMTDTMCLSSGVLVFSNANPVHSMSAGMTNRMGNLLMRTAR